MKRLLLLSNLCGILIWAGCQSTSTTSMEGSDTIPKADSVIASEDLVLSPLDSNQIKMDSPQTITDKGIESLTESQKKRWKEL